MLVNHMNPRTRGFKVDLRIHECMGKRDSRADMLNDDPFSRRKDAPKIHRVHQPAYGGAGSFEGTAPLSGALMQLLGQGMWEKPKHHKGRLWHFSDTEKQHLRLAMGAFTLALGFMAVGGVSGISRMGGLSPWLVFLCLSMPVWALGVGPAFLLHEIGHKLVAKRHGCWAEFRADPKGLQFGIFLSFFLGFLFMAPGAVMVAGLVTRRQNGHIAVAGPLTNFSLFLIGIPLWGLIVGLTGAHLALPTDSFGVLGFRGTYFVDGALVWQAMLFNAGVYWIVFNLILGLFNMLPFGPLDGLKVKDWNDGVFFGVIGVFAVLVYTMFTGAWSPTDLICAVADPISNLLR